MFKLGYILIQYAKRVNYFLIPLFLSSYRLMKYSTPNTTSTAATIIKTTKGPKFVILFKEAV